MYIKSDIWVIERNFKSKVGRQNFKWTFSLVWLKIYISKVYTSKDWVRQKNSWTNEQLIKVWHRYTLLDNRK